MNKVIGYHRGSAVSELELYIALFEKRLRCGENLILCPTGFSMYDFTHIAGSSWFMEKIKAEY